MCISGGLVIYIGRKTKNVLRNYSSKIKTQSKTHTNMRRKWQNEVQVQGKDRKSGNNPQRIQKISLGGRKFTQYVRK